MLVVDFLIDWGIFFQFRVTGRLGLLLLAVNFAVLGWVLWHEWVRHLRPFDPLLVALDIEDKHPELASLLVSYTQLDGRTQNQPDVSLQLIDAMREQAVLQTRKLDFREIVDFGQLKKLVTVAVCIFGFFGIASLMNQGHMQALVQRLAGMDAAYPTQTQIAGISGDLTIRAGDAATVTARATGVIPADGRIYVRPVDKSTGWKALPFKKGGPGNSFQRELKSVAKDMHYLTSALETIKASSTESGSSRRRRFRPPTSN